MSFKRDGNDDQWLSKLMKRRVSELLADDIPENEAFIMKNGRLCCMVCYHRPTFDTLEMLSIHRGGKKHESSLLVFTQKQRELEDLKEKRRHEMYLDGNTTRGGVYSAGASFSSSFLKAEPYNPQVKRKRLKPDERRPVLQITQEDPPPTIKEEPTPSATALARLPGNRRPYQNLRNPDTASHGSASLASDQRCAFGGNDTCKLQTKNPIQVGPNQKLPQTISEYIKHTAAVNKPHLSIKPYMRMRMKMKTPQDQSTGTAGSPPLDNSLDNAGKSEQSRSETRVSLVGQAAGSGKVAKVHQSSKKRRPVTELDEEKKLTAQKYLQATSSGWKLDWTRQKWIRDEDVEFDSDEEPPELPI